jgi:hypothetical protein
VEPEVIRLDTELVLEEEPGLPISFVGLLGLVHKIRELSLPYLFPDE